MPRHEHADLIIAWANGAEIELQNTAGNWVFVKNPCFSNRIKYRVKPENKPDVVRYCFINELLGYTTQTEKSNLKIILDGETGKLKSAEVVK